jgi:putative nucleotidyltransferase with HDIG domain
MPWKFGALMGIEVDCPFTPGDDRAYARQMTNPHRLLDLLAALSYAADRGAGNPWATSLRSSVIAARLAWLRGCEPQIVRDCQIAALLRHVGATSRAHEASTITDAFNDDFVRMLSQVDLARPLGTIAATPNHADVQLLSEYKLRRRKLDRLTQEQIALGHCEVADRLAQRLGAGAAVSRALAQSYERFDGAGFPKGLRGADVSLVARIMHVAQCFEVIFRLAGIDAARKVLAARSGGQLDPDIVDLIDRHAQEMVDGLDESSVLDTFLDEEPTPHATILSESLLDASTVMAHMADLKSTFTLGHSTAVAELADRCAGPMGIVDREKLRAAALVHDIGRLGLPNAIWDKPGPLSRSERLRVEEHSWFTQQILRSSEIFEPLCDFVEVHERLDGSGYHRRVRAAALPPGARLLAVCDVYAALIADRPHRRAFTKGSAAQLLAEEARVGRLDREAVRILLDVVGQPAPKLRGEWPSGLSGREVEVLAMLARGRSNKEIASHLHLAEPTIKNHIARIYEKIGVRTRAAAALFANEHGLLEAGAFEG